MKTALSITLRMSLLILWMLLVQTAAACEPDCEDCWTGPDCESLSQQCASDDDCGDCGYCTDCFCDDDQWWCHYVFDDCHYCLYGNCYNGCDDTCEYCDYGDCVAIQVSPITYAGPQKIWCGQAVTWTFSTIPAGYEDRVSYSPMGATMNGGTITYAPTQSSASASSPFTGVSVTLCNYSRSATDGPVVYHLMGAEFGESPICLNSDASMDWTTSPPTGGPVPTFSGGGPAIDAAGCIDNASPAGTYSYTATGDVGVSAGLTVLTNIAGQWTPISYPSITYPSPAPESGTWTNHYYVPVDMWTAYHHIQTGTIKSYADTLIPSGWDLVQNACAVQASMTVSYTAGLTGGITVFGITLQFGASTEIQETLTFPADEEQRKRVKVHIPRWRVEKNYLTHVYRYEWINGTPVNGDTWHQGTVPSDEVLEYVKLAGWEQELQGACCTD